MTRRRWSILAVGTFAQAATSSFLYGMPMLLPSLRSAEHLTLIASSFVVIAPSLGLLATLIAWGAAADRYGERIVICSGVAMAAVLLLLVPLAGGLIALITVLVAAGAAAASVNAASGRMVMGWFPAAERGLAMGVRQTAQPLGVALAALVLPSLGAAHGPRLALLFPAALCALSAASVAVLAIDPVRLPTAPGAPQPRSPYRGSSVLARVHVASSLLVVPQFAVSTFTLTYLVEQRHWDVAVAGRWIFGFQLAGAVGRIGAGVWSDRVASRLRPMRQLALLSAVLMGVIALGSALDAPWVVAGFALGAVVTVADNGLAYTSVAELAGSAWSGRALGVHNTLQNVTAILTAPVLSLVIGDSRYAAAFALTAIAPAVAISVTPVRAEASRPAGVRAGAGPGSPRS